MAKPEKYRHILAECDLTFKEKDIEDFKYLWDEGRSLEEIYLEFVRTLYLGIHYGFSLVVVQCDDNPVFSDKRKTVK